MVIVVCLQKFPAVYQATTVVIGSRRDEIVIAEPFRSASLFVFAVFDAELAIAHQHQLKHRNRRKHHRIDKTTSEPTEIGSLHHVLLIRII
jgi:hypothetical protein